MTTSEIDKMEAGVELDRMVAEACEVRLDHSGLVIPQLADCKEVQFSPRRRSFKPSTDWSDAMMAAEKVGLFGRMGFSLGRSVDGWMVVYDDAMRAPISINESGPVAICRAILKAKAERA